MAIPDLEISSEPLIRNILLINSPDVSNTCGWKGGELEVKRTGSMYGVESYKIVLLGVTSYSLI